MGKFGALHRSVALVGLVAVGLGAAACKKKSESLIVVGVTTPVAAPDLTMLSVAIAPASGAGATVTRSFPLTAGLSTAATTFGVYIPSDLSGTIDVHVTAQVSAGSCSGYVGSVGPQAQSGSVTMVNVALVAGDVCGTSDAGGAPDAGASGGAGGAGGSGGRADAGASGGASASGGGSGSGGRTDAGASGGSGGPGGSGGANGGADAGSVDARDASVDRADAGGTGGAAGAGGVAGGSAPPSLTHCTEYVHNFDPTAACVTGNPATDVEITAVTFTPDGRYLLSAGNDGRVKIWTWNGSSLSPEGTALGAFPGFTSLSASGDNRLLAVGSAAGTLNVWNVGPGWAAAATLTGITGDVSAIAFGPDDTLYAVDNLKNFYVYTIADLAPRSMMVLGDFPFDLSASPRASDGTYWLGIGYRGGNSSLLKISGTTIGAETPFAVSPTVSGVYSIVFSPNGQLVASGTDNGSFGIWSVPLPTPPTARTPRIALTTDFVWNAAFHTSNAYVAIAAGSIVTNRQVAIWNVTTGAMQAAVPLTSLSNQPRTVTFSPNGAALVVGERNCGKILVCVD